MSQMLRSSAYPNTNPKPQSQETSDKVGQKIVPRCDSRLISLMYRELEPVNKKRSANQRKRVQEVALENANQSTPLPPRNDLTARMCSGAGVPELLLLGTWGSCT
ncbi:hypothetical protein D4L84_09045, partial [Campylobacter coli]